jgi:hypothetical protein
MTEKIEVTVTPVKGVQTFLLGKAADPLPNPGIITLSGNIDSVSRFLGCRKGEASTSRIEVCREEKSISLRTLENDPSGGHYIVGILAENPDLHQFHINEDKLYSVQGLAKLLRLRRIFFLDRDQHEAIMKSLGEFSLKTTMTVNEEDDRKGNTQALQKRVSEIGMGFEFTLNMPIYKGFGKKSFRVEIFADVTDGAVRLWLESIELADLMVSELDTIFKNELSLVSESGIYIIEK